MYELCTVNGLNYLIPDWLVQQFDDDIGQSYFNAEYDDYLIEDSLAQRILQEDLEMEPA